MPNIWCTIFLQLKLQLPCQALIPIAFLKEPPSISTAQILLRAPAPYLLIASRLPMPLQLIHQHFPLPLALPSIRKIMREELTAS